MKSPMEFGMSLKKYLEWNSLLRDIDDKAGVDPFEKAEYHQGYLRELCNKHSILYGQGLEILLSDDRYTVKTETMLPSKTADIMNWRKVYSESINRISVSMLGDMMGYVAINHLLYTGSDEDGPSATTVAQYLRSVKDRGGYTPLERLVLCTKLPESEVVTKFKEHYNSVVIPTLDRFVNEVRGEKLKYLKHDMHAKIYLDFQVSGDSTVKGICIVRKS